eukprot:COSAG06_NODE_56_length_27627_cov_106.527136_21_plen_98_part_00
MLLRNVQSANERTKRSLRAAGALHLPLDIYICPYTFVPGPLPLDQSIQNLPNQAPDYSPRRNCDHLPLLRCGCSPVFVRSAGVLSTRQFFTKEAQHR